MCEGNLHFLFLLLALQNLVSQYISRSKCSDNKGNITRHCGKPTAVEAPHSLSFVNISDSFSKAAVNTRHKSLLYHLLRYTHEATTCCAAGTSHKRTIMLIDQACRRALNDSPERVYISWQIIESKIYHHSYHLICAPKIPNWNAPVKRANDDVWAQPRISA